MVHRILVVLGVLFVIPSAHAEVYCKAVGVPKGCVMAPVARDAGAPGVGVLPGAGAGAAGVGIARLLRLALAEEGASPALIQDAIALVDSRGLVHTGRETLDPDKRPFAWPAERARAVAGRADREPTLAEVVAGIKPTILLGATGMPGTFDEPVIARMAHELGERRPIVMPLSNPTSACEAPPADILRWSQGRALVATGSPFPAVEVDGVAHEIGQANNVFVFPGLGLGAIVAETRSMPDRLFLVAARALAASVSDERLSASRIAMRSASSRSVTRRIALQVVREACEIGIATIAPETDAEAAVDAAMWWPEYVPYRVATDRRGRDS